MRRTALLYLVLAVTSCGGCAMCCGVDDENYGTYGGAWQRHDMRFGRVGSRFRPAGGPVTEEPLLLEGEELPLESVIEPEEPADL